jgi:hypothetical protein
MLSVAPLVLARVERVAEALLSAPLKRRPKRNATAESVAGPLHVPRHKSQGWAHARDVVRNECARSCRAVSANNQGGDMSVDPLAHALHVGGSRTPTLHVVPDPVWPGMWRIRFSDGAKSDMVNLSRAKDAALEIAEGMEARKNPHKWPLKTLRKFSWSASPMRSNRSGDTETRPGRKNAPGDAIIPPAKRAA